MRRPGALHLRFAVRSDPGPVRVDNQDAAYADTHLLALADGMGGHPAGDVAASLVIRPFGRKREAPRWDVVDHLRAATFEGEDAIADYVSRNPQADGMGTTLTAVQLSGDRLGLLHVGDSRAYLLRVGVLYQLSHDDTLVQALVDQGLLSRDEARMHPQRNIVLHALTGREARFDLANFEVHEGDRVLLCSDGVSDSLSEGELTDSLMGDVETAAEQLILRALQAGAADNVTCIVADVVAEEPATAPAFAGAGAANASI